MIARVLIPAFILAVVFWATDWRELTNLISGADLRLLIGAFVIFNIAMFLQGWRWHVLLASNRERWPFWRLQVVHFTAMFFDIIAPGKLGSDAYRIAALRRPGRMHHMVISLVGLRLHGLSAGILCALTAATVLLWTRHGPLASLVPAVLVPAALLLIVLLLHRIGAAGTKRLSKSGGASIAVADHLARAGKAFRNIISQRRTLAFSCILVLIYMLTIISVYATAGRAFDIQLRFWSYLAVVPMLLVAAAVPISIHGRGITEVIAILMWEGPRASKEQILLTCLAVGALFLAQGMLGGIVWIAMRHVGPVHARLAAAPEDLEG